MKDSHRRFSQVSRSRQHDLRRLGKFIDLKDEYPFASPISVKSKFLLSKWRTENDRGLIRPSAEFGLQIADCQKRHRSIIDDPLIAFHAGDYAVFFAASWKLQAPILFHGRAPQPSNERDRPRSAFARPARPDRPSRTYPVLPCFVI